VSLQSRDEWAPLPDLINSGKHRHFGTDVPERRPEAKRNSGRHAAPPVGMSSRMVSRLAFHPLAVRD
jgi:hypothetical protein